MPPPKLPFGYANLAVRGRKLDDVVGPQLERALAMDPDLVSIVGGGNDLLRPSVDLDGLAQRLRGTVVHLGVRADVPLATPTDTATPGSSRRSGDGTRSTRPTSSPSRTPRLLGAQPVGMA